VKGCQFSIFNFQFSISTMVCLALGFTAGAAIIGATNLQQQWSGERQVLRLSIELRDVSPQTLVAMSMDDGKIVSALPIGEGVDATKIEENEAFASCRDGSLTIAREASPGKFEISQVLKTPTGARTMALDSTIHKIYLPTAEMEAPKPAAKGRPEPKPGSFMIVVVARDGTQ